MWGLAMARFLAWESSYSEQNELAFGALESISSESIA
jgi:hypothetical protein